MPNNSKIWISLPSNLKADFESIASKLGLSLNEYCVSCLFSQTLKIRIHGIENMLLKPVNSEKYKQILFDKEKRR